MREKTFLCSGVGDAWWGKAPLTESLLRYHLSDSERYCDVIHKLFCYVLFLSLILFLRSTGRRFKKIPSTQGNQGTSALTMKPYSLALFQPTYRRFLEGVVVNYINCLFKIDVNL